MKTSNETLAGAVRHLADTVQAPDSVPSACLHEAACRIEEMDKAIKDTIANSLCGECGKCCILFYDEHPCIVDSKPCGEVEDLLKLVHPDFLNRESRTENGGTVGNE